MIQEFLSHTDDGLLYFGGARMAFLDIEAGFWGLRRQIEALVGRRLTHAVLQQAGANGGASFAQAFAGSREGETAVSLLRDCLAAYRAAGFGDFSLGEVTWPIGRVCVRAANTFEAWMLQKHGQTSEVPVCAYSAGVLVGFINALEGRRDIVCIEHTCQAMGDEACTFELLPADEAAETAVVAFDPDPFLSQQLNLLDILFDRMPMGIAIFDRDLRIRRFNPTWAGFIDRYTLASAADVTLGVPFFDLLPDVKEGFLPLFQRVLDGETVQQIGLPATSGGITSYWDVTFTPLVENGEVVGVLDVVLDATDRQQMVIELQQSEAHLRSMLESARGYAVYRIAVDPQNPYLGRVVLASPSIREVTGIEDPHRFESWFETIHPDDRDRVVAANRRAVEKGGTFDETMRFFDRRSQTWHWVHTVSNPVFNHTGELTHFNGITMNVTDQKRAEETLAQVNVMLEQKVSERTQELSTLLEVSQNIASTLELEPLLGVVLDQLHSVVAYDGASILELQDDILRLIAYRGPIPGGSARRLVFPLPAAGANQMVIQQQRPIIIPDVLGDTAVARAFQATAAAELETTFAYVRSWMGVPLILRGKVLGMISLDHSQPDFYNEALAHMAQAFASQVAVFIENGRLYTETRQRADETRTLFNVQQAITSHLEPDAVLQLVADEARRLTNTEMSAVYLLDGDSLEIKVVSGDVARQVVGYRLPVAGSIAGMVTQTQRPFLVTDAVRETRVHHDLVERVGAQSFVIVPLLSGGRAIGAITVANTQSGALGPEEERVLTMMASGAVIALENARVYEREQERREVAESLRDILRVLNSSEPLPHKLEKIIEQAQRLLGADAGIIFHVDNQRRQVRREAARGLPPALQHVTILPLIETEATRATLDGRPHVVTDIAAVYGRPEYADSSPPPLVGQWLEEMSRSFKSFFSVPLVVNQALYGDITLYYRAPRMFTEDDLDLAMTFGVQAALAIENARLYALQQERRAVAEGLTGIVGVLNSSRPLPEILNYIVAQASRLMDAAICTLHRVDYQEAFVYIEASHGLPQEARDITGFPLLSSKADESILNREPVAVSRQTWPAPAPALETNLDPRVRRWREIVVRSHAASLAVPLVVADQVYGSLAFYFTEPQPFGDETIDLAMSLGEQAALAIDNASLRLQAEQSAVASERNRLARDLHDAVTQTLFSASLIADVLPRIWERDQEAGRARLAELRELTRGALAEMRALLLELRPATLTESSLSELLQQLATAVIGRSRLPVVLEVVGERPLPPDVQVALYRIAQEALNNVVKHAAAEEVRLVLTFAETAVTLVVSDDGRGFNPDAVGGQSLGLGIMRERADKIDALLEVASQPGQGTTIRVQVAA